MKKTNKIGLIVILSVVLASTLIVLFYVLFPITPTEDDDDDNDDDCDPDDFDVEIISILWQKENLGENLEATTAIDDYGNVYVICDDNLYSFTKDGNERWNTQVSAGDANNPSISPDNEIVYTSGVLGVYSVNTTSGSIIWSRTDIGEEFHTVPAVKDDGSRIYLGAGHESGPSDNFYALNTSDGATAWIYTESESPAEGIRGYMGGAIIDPDGTIYIASQHGYVVSLTDNNNSYTFNWRFNLQAEARQPPSLESDGYIYATSNSGIIHKINKTTGIEYTGENWPALGDVGEIFASMCIAEDGTIYANAEDTNLYAVNPDGSIKWSLEFDVWGSDPLIRNDSKIIVMGQVGCGARVCVIEDQGSKGEIIQASPILFDELPLNEANVNIGPNGTIYIHTGDQEPMGLFAIQGNNIGLSNISASPKYMGNIKNNGLH